MLPPSPAPCISLKDLEQISLLATGMMLSAQRMLDCSSGSHLPGQGCMVQIMLGRHRAGMQWNKQTQNSEEGKRCRKSSDKAQSYGRSWPHTRSRCSVSLLVGQTFPASASLSSVFSSPRESTKPTHRWDNSGCTHLFASTYFKALHLLTLSRSNPSFIRQG